MRIARHKKPRREGSTLRPSVSTARFSVEDGVICFLAVLLAQGWFVTRQTWVQTSPSLGLPMSYVYVSLPVSAAIMLVHAARAIFMRRREEQWGPHS